MMVKSALVKDQRGCSGKILGVAFDATESCTTGLEGRTDPDATGLEERRDVVTDPCDGTMDPIIGSLSDKELAGTFLEEKLDMSGPLIFLLNAHKHLWPFFS